MIFTLSERRGMVNAFMVKIADIQGIVAARAVCINDAVRRYFVSYDRQQRV